MSSSVSSSVVARRYARALLHIAVAHNQVDVVAAGLNEIADALVTSPALFELLSDPNIPRVRKDAVLAEVLRRVAPPPAVETFVRFLSSKRRAMLLDEIRRVFHRLSDLETGRAQAQVTVAAPLDDQQTARLRQQIAALSGKRITLEVAVDAAILGGVVTRIGSTVWDGSLRSHLNTIRESIISA